MAELTKEQMRERMAELDREIARLKAEKLGLLPPRKRPTKANNRRPTAAAIYLDPFTEAETTAELCNAQAILYRRGRELYAPDDIIPTRGYLIVGARPVKVLPVKGKKKKGDKTKAKARKVDDRLNVADYLAANAGFLGSFDGSMPEDLASEIANSVAEEMRSELTRKRKPPKKMKNGEYPASYWKEPAKVTAFRQKMTAAARTQNAITWLNALMGGTTNAKTTYANYSYWPSVDSFVRGLRRVKPTEGEMPYPRGEFRFQDPTRQGNLKDQDRLTALAEKAKIVMDGASASGKRRLRAIIGWAKDPTTSPWWLCGVSSCETGLIDSWLKLPDSQFLTEIETTCPTPPNDNIPF